LIKAILNKGVSMSSASEYELAARYFVDDVPGASIPGARLSGIIERIDAGQSLSNIALAFLAQSGFDALHGLAGGKISRDIFCQRSALERSARIAMAKEKAEAAAATQREKALAMEARAAKVNARLAAMENDPIARRRREGKEMRQRYGIGFVEPEHFPRVMALLRQVDAGKRLVPEDVVWLSAEAQDCWTNEFRAAHHWLEARAFAEEWRRTGNPWAAVNASGHWRKAGAAEKALQVTEAALARASKEPKTHSALCTTRGGAMRDLGQLDDAKALGHEAQMLTPQDYRPCTLLGAVYMQLGEFATGQQWYRKAEALGAERRAIDQDIRSVLACAAKDVKSALIAFLLSQDEQRFSWVRDLR
jgi:Flp pilus assembly protein TadD